MNIQRIPPGADLIVSIKERIDMAQMDRLKHDFHQALPGHRALFVRGGSVEITPLVRRVYRRYTPSLVGHRKG